MDRRAWVVAGVANGRTIDVNGDVCDGEDRREKVVQQAKIPLFVCFLRFLTCTCVKISL